MSLLVCKLYRLAKDGDNFSKELKAATLRTNAKISQEYLDQKNAGWKISGQLYEVDEEATKKRNEAIKPKKKRTVKPKEEILNNGANQD